MFVSVSDEIDAAVCARASRMISRSAIAQLDQDLNGISGALFVFGRDLVRLLLAKQREAYDGKLIVFSRENLELFPRWYLVKALFQPTFPVQAVSSTALNLSHPFIIRSQGSWIH